MHQFQVLLSPDIRLELALVTVLGGVVVLLRLAPDRGERQRTAERRAGLPAERIAGRLRARGYGKHRSEGNSS